MDPLPASLIISSLFAILALLGCAIFSFLETSITALRLFNLKQLSEQNERYRNLCETLEKEPQQILIAILIANCLFNVIAADLITDIMETVLKTVGLPLGWSFILGVSTATIAILLFGEILPKNLAQARSHTLFTSTLWFINFIFKLMAPFVGLLSKLSSFMVKKVNKESTDNSLVSEREIQFLIDYINKKGLMDNDKSQMLSGIFELADTSIREIMVPETDIVMLNIESSMTNALELFSRYHFSRLPVYEEKTSNIIGMIHQKDLFLLLSKHEERPLRELVRPILFVPESMKANQLLRQFKQQRHHIAIVLNEYGGIVGLVTLEDALEEIVGDINDEHEATAEHIVELESDGWLVYGGIGLEKLSKTLPLTFNTETAVTLGGFLNEELQRLPKKGDRYSYQGFVFQIQKATPKRIVQVLIFKDK